MGPAGQQCGARACARDSRAGGAGGNALHTPAVLPTARELTQRSHHPLFRRRQTAALAGAAATLGGAAFYSTLDVQRRFELASATGPLVRLLDPETSHKAGILAARLGLFPKETRPDPDSLRVKLWGKTFTNPLGARGAGMGQLRLAWGSCRSSSVRH